VVVDDLDAVDVENDIGSAHSVCPIDQSTALAGMAVD
jgi:hypothetical protein